MRRHLTAVVVLVALVAGACSSGDDGGSASTTVAGSDSGSAVSGELEDFALEASSACYDIDQVMFNRAINLPRYADQVIDQAEEATSRMAALEPPEADAALVQRNLIEPTVASAQAVLDAAPAMREGATQSWDAFNQARYPALTTAFTVWTADRLSWLRDNGMAECAPDFTVFVRPS